MKSFLLVLFHSSILIFTKTEKEKKEHKFIEIFFSVCLSNVVELLRSIVECSEVQVMKEISDMKKSQ